MEDNEVENAAEEYADDMIGKGEKDDMHWQAVNRDFTAGANWKTERENAELTRTSKELDAMTTKYNELSRKYDDLYRKHKTA